MALQVGDRVYTKRIDPSRPLHPALAATLMPPNGWRMGTLIAIDGDNYRVDFGGLVGTVAMAATEIERQR